MPPPMPKAHVKTKPTNSGKRQMCMDTKAKTCCFTLRSGHEQNALDLQAASGCHVLLAPLPHKFRACLRLAQAKQGTKKGWSKTPALP
ncbi:MAG: hypothetical protein PHN64_00545 [Desulfovibrionaceae bacterium]|nr:hypothetical protein [Desulfovibrionaceae bacterium]